MNVVCIFGPSCSGKSTLGKALQNALGDSWIYVDRDILIEHNVCAEWNVDEALEARIESVKQRVIVDAQLPWRAKREKEMYVLVLPPLKTLLERDAERTARLLRSEERAYRAQEYVIKTFNALDRMEKSSFDQCFDSSRVSLQEEIESIKDFLS